MTIIYMFKIIITCEHFSATFAVAGIADLLICNIKISARFLWEASKPPTPQFVTPREFGDASRFLRKSNKLATH